MTNFVCLTYLKYPIFRFSEANGNNGTFQIFRTLTVTLQTGSAEPKGKNFTCNVFKLRTPFKDDSRCALFSLLSFVTINSTPQREAQRMSCLKGV